MKFRFRICRDDSPVNPFQEGEGIIILGSHKRYNIGRHRGALEELEKNYKFSWNSMIKRNIGWDGVRLELLEVFKGALILPVFALDHGDVNFSCVKFNDRFDSGQVGFVIMTKETRSDNLENDVQVLHSHVKIYSDYFNGEVYGWELECEGASELEGSCWGYISSVPPEDVPFPVPADVVSKAQENPETWVEFEVEVLLPPHISLDMETTG